MAFAAILGATAVLQTELFNLVRQCCFRPDLPYKQFQLLESALELGGNIPILPYEYSQAKNYTWTGYQILCFV